MDGVKNYGTASLDALFEKLNLPIPKNESQSETSNEEGEGRKAEEKVESEGEGKKRGRPRGRKPSPKTSEGTSEKYTFYFPAETKRELNLLWLAQGGRSSFSRILCELIHEKYEKTSFEFLENAKL